MSRVYLWVIIYMSIWLMRVFIQSHHGARMWHKDGSKWRASKKQASCGVVPKIAQFCWHFPFGEPYVLCNKPSPYLLRCGAGITWIEEGPLEVSWFIFSTHPLTTSMNTRCGCGNEIILFFLRTPCHLIMMKQANNR